MIEQELNDAQLHSEVKQHCLRLLGILAYEFYDRGYTEQAAKERDEYLALLDQIDH